jgi:hypothetical protein
MAAKTKIVANAVDTWINGLLGKRSTKYRGTAGLRLKSGEAIAFVYFAAPMPRGSKVGSAILRLYTRGSWGGATPVVSVQRVGTRFTVSNATWNNAPGGTGATVTRSKASSGDGDMWDINVTALMQAVADGQPWYGFRITQSTATAREFRSAQAQSRQPTLTVSWTEPPSTPTGLSPSQQSVNAAKPVVEADYTDTSGTTTLASMQVQVAASAAMTTPWDSGEVLTVGSKARLDLNTTTYPGLAEGGIAYWRMRVKDSAGEWSAWSAVTSWNRAAKGAVTITSPSDVAPTVADFTPPILWSFTKVQEKWQVLVRRLDLDGDNEVFDSGEVPGIETECTVAARGGAAVLQPGVPYEVEVRAWDDADRIGTTDDPPYSVATRAFTVTTGATTPVTNLRFEQTIVGGSMVPGLTVAFDRASAPDAFTITRNGVPIATNVEPSDFAVTGSTYRLPLTNVRPNVDNLIGVSAIVNNVASPIVTAAGKVKIAGVWLVEKDASRAVLFGNTSGSKFAQTEDGDTIVPLGATEGIRITQGLRGYEGTVTGVLASIGEKTRDQWIDIFLAMREETGKVRRLVVGSEVFDVVTWNMSVDPTGHSTPGVRACSFDFMQVGARRKGA